MVGHIPGDIQSIMHQGKEHWLIGGYIHPIRPIQLMLFEQRDYIDRRPMHYHTSDCLQTRCEKRAFRGFSDAHSPLW